MSSDSTPIRTLSNDALSLPELCNACGSPGTFRCSGCSYVWYCSTGCQAYDSQAHSELCNLFAGPSLPASSQAVEYPGVPYEPTRLPAPSHPALVSPSSQQLTWTRIPEIQRVRAFVLPVDSSHCRDVVIELPGSLSPTGAVRWVPDLNRIFGNHISPVDAICTRGTGGTVIRFPLHFFFEVSPDVMSSLGNLQRNQCAYDLTKGATDVWKGTIVVLKFNGGRRRGYQNIERSDLWNIRHYLAGS